jgi:hypothetical protein
MEAHQLFNYMMKEINTIRSEQAIFLASGRAANYDEYRHVCGVIRGLNHAENIVKDLVQKMEKSNE